MLIVNRVCLVPRNLLQFRYTAPNCDAFRCVRRYDVNLFTHVAE